MNIVLIALCFLSAALITFSRSAGPGLVLVYLPAVLLFSPVSELYVPGLPDANPAGAAIYGILLASLVAGRRPRLRVTSVDCVVALLLCSYAISAATTSHAYRAVSIFGSLSFDYGFLSYFIVRVALQRQAPPRLALALLVATMFVISLFALIELRLWPETYKDLLRWLGLMDAPRAHMAMRRFGVFRAMVSFGHAIDLGISAALTFAMIAMFAWRMRLALSKVWILGGLAAALLASFCGISFSAFMGVGCAVLLYWALLKFPRSRRLLPAAGVLLVLTGLALAAHLATSPTYEQSQGGTEFAGSFRNRQELLQLSYEIAKTSGLFGRGDTLPEEIDRSVDNSYLLITMKRGWVALLLWLALPICLAALASRGVRRTRSRRQVQFILVGFSAVIGTMIAMFTVWFGFVYPQLFMTVVALTTNESQAAIHARQPLRKRAVAPRGIGGVTSTRAQNSRGRRSVLIE